MGSSSPRHDGRSRWRIRLSVDARRLAPVTKWVVLTVVLAAVTGCTRLVGGSPQARPAPPEAAPITPTQAHDLLSQNAQPGEGYVIDRVEPQRCSGVALEVNPPFIASPGPLATGGGHWTTSVGGEVFLEEFVAVYPSSFDPAGALSAVEQTIDSCLDTPLTVPDPGGDYVFEVLPRVDSESEAIVLWSFRASDWRCDNAFIAAHNAAIEITSCGATGGFDIASAAKDALDRIEKLANATT